MAKHILVIDDAPGILDLYNTVFTAEGCTVSLHAAIPPLTVVEALRPDLIVVDCIFEPGMPGFCFIQTLRRQPATTTIPVILCTAETRLVQTVREALTKAQVTVVFKPFDLDYLLEVLATPYIAA